MVVICHGDFNSEVKKDLQNDAHIPPKMASVFYLEAKKSRGIVSDARPMHKLRKREDWTRNFRSFILRPILAQFTTMTVVHFPGT
jgi:hypothetical protein